MPERDPVTGKFKPGEGPDAGAGGKKKFDPDTLPPEVRAIYDGMQAEFTTKMQSLKGREDTFNQQMAEMAQRLERSEGANRYYERYMPYVVGEGEDAGAGAEAGFPAFVAERGAGGGAQAPRGNGVERSMEWNPFDRTSIEGVAQEAVRQYHQSVVQVYNQLVKGITELQAYNLQAMKILARDPEADISKIVQLAPQYGNNLEQAYRAAYESPKVFERAKAADTFETQIKDLQGQIKTLEKKTATAPGAVLGGTTGPIPRAVAKQGQKATTYQGVASQISPEEIYAPDGEAGVGTTEGAGAESGAA